jgi:hypothetical protein
MFSRSANSPGDPLSRRSTRLPLNTPFSKRASYYSNWQTMVRGLCCGGRPAQCAKRKIRRGVNSPRTRVIGGHEVKMPRLFLSVIVLVWGIGLGAAEESPLLDRCLRGANNAHEVKESRTACTDYVANLMQGVRFGGIARPHQRALPFCLPSGNLTEEQLNLIHRRFTAVNPQIESWTARVIEGVIVVKVYRCNSSN